MEKKKKRITGSVPWCPHELDEVKTRKVYEPNLTPPVQPGIRTTTSTITISTPYDLEFLKNEIYMLYTFKNVYLYVLQVYVSWGREGNGGGAVRDQLKKRIPTEKEVGMVKDSVSTRDSGRGSGGVNLN